VAVWVLAAWAIDAFGLGRGFALMLLLELAFALFESLRLGWNGWRSEVMSPLLLLLLPAALVALIFAFSWLHRQALRLVGSQALRLPTCGLFPLDLTLLLLLLPSTFVTWFDVQGLDWLHPGSGAFVGLEVALLLLLAWPASRLFYWRQQELRQADPQGWLKLVAFSSGFLMALVLVDSLAARLFRDLPDLWPGTLLVLGLWALGADWLEEWRLHRLGGGWRPLAQYQDLSDALSARADHLLSHPDRQAQVTGLRYRSLTYFFGPFVPMILWERAAPSTAKINPPSP